MGTILPMDLFPDTAAVVDGHLSVAGVPASALAEEHGTPLLVLCEATLRARARAYREAAPDALVVYGTKAFPNVSVMRLLAEEGLGADVSTLGELRFAQQAGIGGDALVVHGNNKDDAELAAAGAAGALVVLDALDEVERAAAAGVTRTLVRLTLGVEAETHEAIRTGQHGSKFGLPPEQALELIERARPLGLHVHIGSQLLDGGAAAPHRRPARRVRGALPRRARLDAGDRRPRRRARRAHLAGRARAAVDRRLRARAARAAGTGVGRARPPDARS